MTQDNKDPPTVPTEAKQMTEAEIEAYGKRLDEILDGTRWARNHRAVGYSKSGPPEYCPYYDKIMNK
jgi:hypothetical protein